MVLNFLNGRSGGNTEVNLMQALKGKQSGHTISCYIAEDELISSDGTSMCIRRVYIKDSAYDIGWVVDEDVDDCMCCGDVFSWFKRRHHCRNCGNLVCGDCSPFKSKVPNFPETNSRVCKDCFGLKLEKSQTKRWSSFNEADSIMCTDRINDMNNYSSSKNVIRRQRASSFDSRNVSTSNEISPLKQKNNTDIMDDLASFVMAYKKMRRIIPLNIWDTTVSNLEDMGIPSSITTRIWNTRALWLIVMPPQDIIKIHIADLRSKYAPVMLDIVETRALWFALSKVNEEEWEKHPQKVEWKENLGQSLQSMACRERAGNLSKLEQRNPAYFTRGDDGVECTEEIVLDLFDPEALIEKRYFTVGNGKTVRHSFKSEDENEIDYTNDGNRDEDINKGINTIDDALVDIDIYSIESVDGILESILDQCQNIRPFACTESSDDLGDHKGKEEVLTTCAVELAATVATVTEEQEEEEEVEVEVIEEVEKEVTEKVIEETEIFVEEKMIEAVEIENKVTVAEVENNTQTQNQTLLLSRTPKSTTPIVSTTSEMAFTPASLSRTRLMMYADNKTSISSPNDPWAWSSPSTSDVSNSPISPGIKSARSPVKSPLSKKLHMQRQILSPTTAAASRNRMAMATFNSMRSPQYKYPSGYTMSMIGASTIGSPVMGAKSNVETLIGEGTDTLTPKHEYNDRNYVRHVGTPWAKTPSAIRGVLRRHATDTVAEVKEHEMGHSFFYSDNESEGASPETSILPQARANTQMDTEEDVSVPDTAETLQEVAKANIDVNINGNHDDNNNIDTANAANVLGLDCLGGYLDSPASKVNQVSPESTTTDNSNFMQCGLGANGNALGLESMSDYFASPEFQNLTPPLRARSIQEKLKGKQNTGKSPTPITVSSSQLKQDLSGEERSPQLNRSLNEGTIRSTSIDLELTRKRSPNQSPMPEHLFHTLASSSIDIENKENIKMLKRNVSDNKAVSDNSNSKCKKSNKKVLPPVATRNNDTKIKENYEEFKDIQGIRKEFSDLLVHGKATKLRQFAEEYLNKTDLGDPITAMAKEIDFSTRCATDVLIQCARDSEVLEEALETLMILCDLGGDVNAKDTFAQGRSVLASVFNQPLLGRFLLMRGADPLQEDDDGESTLKLCVEYGYDWILEATQSSRMITHFTQTSLRKRAYIEAVMVGGRGSTIKSLVEKGNLQLSSEEATDLLVSCKQKSHEMENPDSTYEILKQLGAQE